jgi:hypothetical protein
VLSALKPPVRPTLVAAFLVALSPLSSAAWGVTRGAAPGGDAAVAATVPVAVPASSVSRASSRDRLRCLVMLPPEAFHVAYEGKRTVLRFSADVLNSGTGPFDVTGVCSTTRTPSLKVTQTILRFGRPPRHVKTVATRRWSHLDGHEHFHVQNFERYRLRAMGSST